ncbi:hypothetical protein HON52_01620 [Candidatus Uhrbacteria bacterium]|jgi:ribosomal subunit interface protein|nr:hypothetical protein [Candidatus Uhrbacteria bacterium]
MKLQGITVKEIELTPAIEEYVLKRVAKLSKICQKEKSATIRVELGERPSQHRGVGDSFYAELDVTIKDQHFNVKKHNPNIYRAIEKARVDMHQKIIKWKKKDLSTQRKNGAEIKKFLRSADYNE